MTPRLRLLLPWFAVTLGACGDDAQFGDSGADSGSVMDGLDSGGVLGGGPAPAPHVDGGARSNAATCGDFGRNAACTRCLAEMCCAQGAACYASDACFGLDECARHCGADARDCVVGCGDQHPSGRGDYNALVLCMGEHCLEACPFAAP